MTCQSLKTDAFAGSYRYAAFKCCLLKYIFSPKGVEREFFGIKGNPCEAWSFEFHTEMCSQVQTSINQLDSELHVVIDQSNPKSGLSHRGEHRIDVLRQCKWGRLITRPQTNRGRIMRRRSHPVRRGDAQQTLHADLPDRGKTGLADPIPGVQSRWPVAGRRHPAA